MGTERLASQPNRSGALGARLLACLEPGSAFMYRLVQTSHAVANPRQPRRAARNARCKVPEERPRRPVKPRELDVGRAAAQRLARLAGCAAWLEGNPEVRPCCQMLQPESKLARTWPGGAWGQCLLAVGSAPDLLRGIEPLERAPSRAIADKPRLATVPSRPRGGRRTPPCLGRPRQTKSSLQAEPRRPDCDLPRSRPQHATNPAVFQLAFVDAPRRSSAAPRALWGRVAQASGCFGLF